MEQENRNQQNAAPQVSIGDQIKVRREKLAQLQAEGMDPFAITRFVSTTTAQEIKDHFDEMEGKPVSIAGRLMSKRGMGKVSFCDLQDKTGRIQLYARKDEMDEAEYNRFKKYDIGDIVGVEGEIFRTQRGEMSVRAKKITLLSKSLLPLPEKFHGLTDKETRYRQRYVDLIVNPEVKRNLLSVRSSSSICGTIWIIWAISRLKRPFSIPSPAVRQRVRSSRTTIRSTSICICVLRLNCR